MVHLRSFCIQIRSRDIGTPDSPLTAISGLDSEQSYGPHEEEGGSDDDHGAIVMVDDRNDNDAVVIADDHDPDGTSNTFCGGNSSNRRGGEENIGTSLTGSATPQESLKTIQTVTLSVLSCLTVERTGIWRFDAMNHVDEQ